MNARSFGLLFVALALGLAVGCARTTVQGPDGKKLTLVKPADQTLKRGETNGVLVTVTRNNFRDQVAIKFEDLPKGVKVEDKDTKIASDKNTATFTLKADPDADLVENHVAKVVVSGPDNMSATETFKLTVKDKGT